MAAPTVVGRVVARRHSREKNAYLSHRAVGRVHGALHLYSLTLGVKDGRRLTSGPPGPCWSCAGPRSAPHTLVAWPLLTGTSVAGVDGLGAAPVARVWASRVSVAPMLAGGLRVGGVVAEPGGGSRP